MASIYISCPIRESIKDLMQAVHELESYGHIVKYWDRTPHYNEELLESSDAVAFVLPNFSWSTSLSLLPPGVRKELDTSILLNKDMYIVYRRRLSGVLGLYTAKVNNYGRSIAQITASGWSTRATVRKSVRDLIYKESGAEEVNDRRVLLLLTNS